MEGGRTNRSVGAEGGSRVVRTVPCAALRDHPPFLISSPALRERRAWRSRTDGQECPSHLRAAKHATGAVLQNARQEWRLIKVGVVEFTHSPTQAKRVTERGPPSP
jgi:hypothetical protein